MAWSMSSLLQGMIGEKAMRLYKIHLIKFSSDVNSSQDFACFLN